MAKKKFLFGEKNAQDLLLLAGNKEFKPAINNLHKKFGLSSFDGEIDGKEQLEFMQDPKVIEFFKDSQEFIDKFNLSNIFSILIATLVKRGHFARIIKGEKVDLSVDEIMDILRESLGVKITDKGKNYTTITINSDTTIEDIRKCWPEIQKSLGKKSGRKKRSNNLERNLYIKALKDKGLKPRDIVEKVRKSKKFRGEIVGYEEVPKIANAVEAKAAKNVPDKES
jgi:hypothetical protein